MVKYITVVIALLFAVNAHAASFPTQGGNRNTWGTDLRNFFSPYFNLSTGDIVPGSIPLDGLASEGTLTVDSASLKMLNNSIKFVSQYASFNAAITAIGSSNVTLYRDVATSLTATATVPSTLSVVGSKQGIITASNGAQLIINGPWQDGDYQVFSGFSAGDVTGLKEARPEWFGSDNAAWQAAADALVSKGVLKGTPGANYILDTVTISDAMTIDLNGATISGGTGQYWLDVQSSNVTVKSGYIGTGTENKGIRVGTYTNNTTFTSYSGFRLADCNISTAVTTSSRDFVQLFGHPSDVWIEHNNFVNTSGPVGSGNEHAAISLRTGDTTASPNYPDEPHLNLHVSGNYFRGWRHSFANNSSGYSSGFFFTNNEVEDCATNYSAYHLYDAHTIGNVFRDNTGASYLWRAWDVSHNTWTNSGSAVGACLVEAIQGSFDHNIIIDSPGHGLIVDGGNSDSGVIDTNIIRTSTLSGIYMNPNYNYGGTFIGGPTIKGNRIFHNQEHGIFGEGGTFRNVVFDGNIITGNGVSTSPTTTTYGAIVIDLTDNSGYLLSNVIFKNNAIWNRDSSSGVQDSNQYYGIRIDDTGVSTASIFRVEYNDIRATVPVSNVTTGGQKFVVFNTIGDTTAMDISTGGTRLVDHNVDLNTGTIP